MFIYKPKQVSGKPELLIRRTVSFQIPTYSPFTIIYQLTSMFIIYKIKSASFNNLRINESLLQADKKL
jgi:hypothetical protein